MSAVIHEACGAPAEPRPPGDGLPPEPDRHGNVRVRFYCPECDESATVLEPPFGGASAPAGWTVE
jgi:hypothetical protein